MKRKMIFVAMVLALFVLQAQSVFAQNVSFQLDLSNGGVVRANGQTITDRIRLIGIQVRDSGMAIIVEFKDGSTQSYAFVDIDEVENEFGETTWSNVRMLNPNTGGLFPERFAGTSKIYTQWGASFSFSIFNPNNPRTPILQAAGDMRQR